MTTMRKLTATLAGILGLSLWLALPASAALAAVPRIQQAATTCGVWRWPVKTGSDKDRFKVHRMVTGTTVHHLRSLTPPSSFPDFFQNHRFRGAERHTYRLTARLTQFRLEDDGDIHLVLRNKAGKSMIAEIPRPRCVSSLSLSGGMPSKRPGPPSRTITTSPPPGTTFTAGSRSEGSVSSMRSTT